MRKLLLTLALCGAGLFAMGSAARATPIAGEIHFAGLWAPSGGAGTATATGIDFTAFQVVLAGTGTYTGLTGTGATFQNFTFAPFASPVVPLWSLPGGFSFDLNSVAVALQNATQLALTGTGVLHAAGFDDTPAAWNFTGNAGGTLFSFSADNVVVPEPTTVGLVALGLAGLGAAGQKRARCTA